MILGRVKFGMCANSRDWAAFGQVNYHASYQSIINYISLPEVYRKGYLTSPATCPQRPNRYYNPDIADSKENAIQLLMDCPC